MCLNIFWLCVLTYSWTGKTEATAAIRTGSCVLNLNSFSSHEHGSWHSSKLRVDVGLGIGRVSVVTNSCSLWFRSDLSISRGSFGLETTGLNFSILWGGMKSRASENGKELTGRTLGCRRSCGSGHLSASGRRNGNVRWASCLGPDTSLLPDMDEVVEMVNGLLGIPEGIGISQFIPQPFQDFRTQLTRHCLNPFVFHFNIFKESGARAHGGD